MTPAFTARRRAEEFDSLIAGTSTSALRNARDADLLELVATLRTAAPVVARPTFVVDLRLQLMAEAATALTPAPVEPRVAQRRTRRERRVALAMGGFAIVGATTSMAVAAQTALPGDTLYPLKRAIENAQTGFQVDDDAKGTVMLANASGRLDELDELSRGSDRADAATIADTLYAFTEQATEASNLLLAAYQQDGQATSIEELRAFTADSMVALTDLEEVVPVEARPALLEAAQVLEQIDAQARYACPACSTQPLTEIPALAASSIDDLLGKLGGTDAAPAVEPAAEPRDGKDRKPGKQRQGDDQNNDNNEVSNAPGPAEPDIVVDPPEQPGLPQPGTGDDEPDNDDQDPIEGLTDRLSGGNSTSGGEGGLDVVLGGAVEDVTDGLNDPLLP
ncbi:MAG: DUF5667 domain-containing protein [Nocardioides sp.]